MPDAPIVAEQFAYERDQLWAISARITALGPPQHEEGVSEALWFLRSAAVFLGIVATELGHVELEPEPAKTDHRRPRVAPLRRRKD